MKKSILFLLSILICTTTVNAVMAKTTSNSSLTSAIRLYKAHNYSQCYTLLNDIVQQDPSNAVAYYYLAMTSAQIGKKEEAINNYNKVLTLSPSGKLGTYATKGKTCLETPEKCHEQKDEDMDSFIHSKYGLGFSESVRSEYEKQKIENLKREINRKDDVELQKFKDYKDFSSEVPTNDEIVAAIKTLQKAGLADIINHNNNLDLSLIMGEQNYNYNNSSAAMLNMLMGSSGTSISPQVIQSLLTNQMSTNF